MEQVQRPLVSLCMIVRDEEMFLKSCLNSVGPFAEEIVVVDTGSADRTIDIAKEAGAQVHSFNWNGSFAEARNYGLERATGQWILYMDADEQLEVHDVHRWLEALHDPSARALAIRIVNYYGKDEVKESDAYLLSQIRLFRNDLGLTFEGAIHEQLNLREKLPGLKGVSVLPAEIHHYGYIDSIADAKGKQMRNAELLEAEQEKPDYHPWVDYHVANLYYQDRGYKSAVEWVNRAIKRFLERKEVPPSMLYKLKYEALLKAGYTDDALLGIDKAIRMYPDYVDLHYCKGRLLYSARRYAEASESFQTCLALGDGHPFYLVQRGAGSFLAEKYAERCRSIIADASAGTNDGGERA
ncbi:glycosyltransferase [Cohnella sp. GCM10027633]|uniref:glycosyltransferase n=1 Tax=unclassified Cohnella TaxID=2636738 RepID=UPI00362E5FA9